MNYNKIFVIVFVLALISCEQKSSSSDNLKTIIAEVESHQGYDRNEHPLGLFTRDYYKSEADFAQGKLDELELIETNSLSESEQISVDLLKFILQDKINTYQFESFLNPLLSDSGFHTNLPHHVRSFVSKKQVLNYINKLNAIPDFVDQHILLIQEGVEKGIVQPKIIFNNFEDFPIYGNPSGVQGLNPQAASFISALVIFKSL